MLLGRSIIAITTMILWVNVGLKKAVWDGVKGPNVAALSFRTVQGALTNIISYSSTKYLPLTVIAIINNLGPLATVILAYIILKERLKAFEMVVMLISLGTVITFSLFDSDDKGADKSNPPLPMWALYVALGFNPVLSSGGTIAMRKMKKFHEAVVSWYLNWCLGITSVSMILIRK